MNIIYQIKVSDLFPTYRNIRWKDADTPEDKWKYIKGEDNLTVLLFKGYKAADNFVKRLKEIPVEENPYLYIKWYKGRETGDLFKKFKHNIIK